MRLSPKLSIILFITLSLFIFLFYLTNVYTNYIYTKQNSKECSRLCAPLDSKILDNKCYCKKLYKWVQVDGC